MDETKMSFWNNLVDCVNLQNFSDFNLRQTKDYLLDWSEYCSQSI